MNVGDHTLDEEATRKDEYLQKRTIDTTWLPDIQEFNVV